jgi:hypothetical protein
MAAKETPIGIALILCDLILFDEPTKKRSLIGLFSAVNARSFPAVISKVCVLASITNINGELELTLGAHNETTGHTILEIPAQAQSEDPNAVMDIAFEFDNFSFPNPGLYSFDIRGDGAIILATRVNVQPLSAV